MVNWHIKWAVFVFCQKSKIFQNQIMIESDHKSWTLFRSPRQKVGGPNWWARTDEHFYAAQNLKIIFKSYAFLQNSLRDFFITSHILNFWKMLFRSLKKCVIKFQKSEIRYVHFFFVFPCRSSWNMTFFLYLIVSGSKLA